MKKLRLLGVLSILLSICSTGISGCSHKVSISDMRERTIIFDEAHYPAAANVSAQKKGEIIADFRRTLNPMLGTAKLVVGATKIIPESAVYYFLSCAEHSPPFKPVIRIVFSVNGAGDLGEEVTENFIKIMSTVPGWVQGDTKNTVMIGDITAIASQVSSRSQGGVISVEGKCDINSDPTGISDDDLKFEHEIEVRHPKEIRYLFVNSPPVPFFHS